MIFALFVTLDLLFLRWVWVQFECWGFWDWDYQQTLLEVTRISWVEHLQIPLWNPYIRGGVTLAGNTLNHAFGPCLLPVLLFGTIAGIKIDLMAYLLIGQAGIFLLARYNRLSRDSAFLVALIYSLGGIYAQRLTHGHFEWIAMAWIPFVLLMIHKSIDRSAHRTICLGGLFLSFLFLDGGPYQFAFLAVFLGMYTLLMMIRKKSAKPLIVMMLIGMLGAGLAGVKLFPVLETVVKYPRPSMELNFYGAPFVPTATELLHQAFLSRAQTHDSQAWMPYILNVGCYVGWIPLILAALALLLRPRRLWFQAVLLLFFGWIMLGSVFSFTPWALISKTPGLTMLRVPSRFNLFVLLMLALLAGEGLQLLKEHVTKPIWRTLVPGFLIALVALDLIWVNGKTFQKAFCIPPIEVRQAGDFKIYSRSPYLDTYKSTALYETFPNWVGAAYPAVLENKGVLDTYRTIHCDSSALPFDHPDYEGEAVIHGERGKIVEVRRTPNRISITTDGQGSLLTLNQNYDEGWKCEGHGFGTMMNVKGRLTLKLVPGQTKYDVVYRPDAFVLGACVSLLTLLLIAGSGFWLWFRKRPHQAQASHPGIH
ncbi:MAG: YfhO family protein [Planctomycetota bacterium]